MFISRLPSGKRREDCSDTGIDREGSCQLMGEIQKALQQEALTLGVEMADLMRGGGSAGGE